MPFRIAVIGCGSISMGYHGPSYQKYAAEHEDTQLAACCDLDFDRGRLFCEKFGFNKAYTDWKEMLDWEKPDAVCLNVPPPLTPIFTIPILRMGYPLLLEKPPGLTEADVDEMIHVADETGTPNQVAFNRRYAPLVAHLRDILVQRFTPEQIQHICYDFCRIGRTDADFSTTAIHGIDAARFIVNSDYAVVNFHYREFPRAGPSVANIFMDCTFRSGATAQLSFLPLSGAVIERAQVHALDRIYFLNTPIWMGFDFPGSLLVVEKGMIIERLDGSQAASASEDFILNGFYQENQAFFEDIRNGRKPAGDIRSGRQPVIIAQALRERRPQVVFDDSA